MLDEIVVLAPAKVNLGLRVKPVREDGFHNLESIFQTVELKDKLMVSKAFGRGFCTVKCDAMELPEKNTVNTAYSAFCEVTERELQAVNVQLEKHIPAGGGLGGGSSDAASMIIALEKMFDIQLTENQLDRIAGKVGSDVFFFTRCDEKGSCCAVVTGRGENVRVIGKRSDLNFVLVFPDVHSSTKEAYALVDELLKTESASYAKVGDLESVYNSKVENWHLKNTFTDALAGKYPAIAGAFKVLRETKPLYSEMSGSGSTIFGIYASWEEAEKAAELISKKGLNCVATK